MSDYEFWKDLGNIFDSILHYQKKNAEFNDRFINPWIRLGNVFDKDDRNKEAVQAYRHAVDIDPASAQNWTDLGDAHFKAGSYDDAISAYQKAVELDAKAGWPLSNLALTLATQGRHEDAIPLYAMSIDLFADNKDKAITWNRLGNLYRKLNDYEHAFQSFQKADELDGENTGFRDQLDETVEVDSTIAPRELLNQMIVDQPAATDEVTIVHVVTDDVAEVEQVGILPNEEMIVLEESAPVASEEVELSIELQEIKALAEEENYANWLVEELPAVQPGQVLEAAPSPAWLEELIAQDEVEIEDEAEALKQDIVETIASTSDVTMEAVETFTEFVPAAKIESAAENDSVSEIQLQAEEEAPIVEQEILQVEESVAEVESGVDVEDQNLEAAYEEYLKDSAMPVQTLSDRFEAIHAQAPETQVSANGDVRIAMDTRNAHVWNELGNVYLNSGACEDAIDAYRKAIELDRQFAWPYSNLALAYVQKGLFTEAIVLYQRGIELFAEDKDKAITWNRLGNVYRRLNDYSRAISSYHNADELDPDNTTISLRSHYGLLGNIVEQKAALVS